MKIFLALVSLLVTSTAHRHQNVEDYIDEINAKQDLWTAGKNFKNRHFTDFRGLLGSKKLPENVSRTIPVMKHDIENLEFPEHFDARENWPECPTIGQVRDQSACDSCWAVAVASVISDRICIHSKGKYKPEISAKHLMACDGLSTGCITGFPYYGFLYWRHHGVVTGGGYGSNIGCQPYPFPPCEHQHIDGPKDACPDDEYETPKCVARCDKSSLNFEDELFVGDSEYKVHEEAHIQAEIMKHGPVTADFDLFDDFVLYKSGVYYRVSEEVVGRHAAKLIGWGVENGTKYWLGVNSWNEDWGDKGFFKIRRGFGGVGECEIESEIFAGIPHPKSGSPKMSNTLVYIAYVYINIWLLT